MICIAVEGLHGLPQILSSSKAACPGAQPGAVNQLASNCQKALQLRASMPCHRDPALGEMYALVRSQGLLESRLSALAHQVSDANLQQMPDFQQRVEVLKQLEYIAPDNTVQLKVIACFCCSTILVDFINTTNKCCLSTVSCTMPIQRYTVQSVVTDLNYYYKKDAMILVIATNLPRRTVFFSCYQLF